MTTSILLLEGSMSGLGTLILGIYLVCHSPAILCIIIGLFIRKKNPETAKKLFIFAGIYFVIGLGICGNLL